MDVGVGVTPIGGVPALALSLSRCGTRRRVYNNNNNNKNILFTHTNNNNNQPLVMTDSCFGFESIQSINPQSDARTIDLDDDRFAPPDPSTEGDGSNPLRRVPIVVVGFVDEIRRARLFEDSEGRRRRRSVVRSEDAWSVVRRARGVKGEGCVDDDAGMAKSERARWGERRRRG